MSALPSTSSDGVANIAPSTSSTSSATLPGHLFAQKRVHSDTAATIQRKRQKQRDNASEKREKASCNLVARWAQKAASVEEWRPKMSQELEKDRSVDLLIKSLNIVRAADQRPLISTADAALIPQDPALYSFLLAVYAAPFNWDTLSFKEVACLADDTKMVEDDLAEYYIRRLKFSGRDTVKTLLESVCTEAPHYRGQCENLLKAIEAIPNGEIFLSYGGYTVANSPIGRDLDDKDSSGESGSFLKYVLNEYEGTISVYEIPSLSFRVGSGGRDSVKESRGDVRTGLYESLVVDSFGFLSLNTAAPGNVIQLELTEKFLKVQAAIAERRKRAPARGSFPWQKT
jgi:hypothetical protein